MSNAKTFQQVWRKHGFVSAVIKSLARLIGKRVLIDGVDTDYPIKPVLRDMSMPAKEDSAATHKGYVRWNHVLPLPTDRMMLHIGAETVENFLVVADAWAQALSHFILPGSHVMDVGCGCGRTARLLAVNPNVLEFTGFDVVEPYIDWCNRFFSETYPGRFSFHHLDVQTERYNPNGKLSCKTTRFPSADGTINLIYAASVFTHLYPEDLSCYAAEMNRVLKSDGLAVVSIHDQPKGSDLFSGSEHRADYKAGHFLSLMQKAGFVLHEDIGDLCGQRTFVLQKV